MKFNIALYKNWKQWVALPYLLVVLVLLSPLVVCYCFGVVMKVLGKWLEDIALFRTKYDLFYIDKITEWRDK